MQVDAGTQVHHGLRVPRTSLVGREQDIRAVGGVLRSNDVGLVTLTGAGGVGKTQLALHVALAARASFDDDVVLVDLSVVADAAYVIPSIARSAGIQTTTGTAALEAVIRYFRPRGTLLVLDNLEHVIEASEGIAELLASCPGLTVLATSREPLQLRDEHVYPVTPLSIPGPTDDLSLVEIAGYDSVRLFQERARSVQPDFSLTPDNVEAVTDICRRLDGLPLAIELAATRSNVLPPNAMQTRLQDLLPMLSGVSRDVPQRQRTMSSTIRWSYDLLTPEEQQFLRFMVVFTGGVTLDGATFVTGRLSEGTMDPLALLSALVDKSLIRREGDGEELRFTILETIRQFGDDELREHGELGPTRAAHADWCADFAARAAESCRVVVPIPAMQRLELELTNFRAALTWLAETRQPEKLARLATDLGWFWYVARHEHEGVSWLRRVSSFETGVQPETRAEAAQWAAMLAQRVHHPDVEALLD